MDLQDLYIIMQYATKGDLHTVFIYLNNFSYSFIDFKKAEIETSIFLIKRHLDNDSLTINCIRIFT
jgi:hypothetical protein